MKNFEEKISAFGYEIYKFNLFNDGKHIQEDWIDLALKELKDPNVRDNQSCNLDKNSVSGETLVWSSFETPARSFFDFQNSEMLLEWIVEKVHSVAEHFDLDSIYKPQLTIDWMNVMYKGSFGNCHTHDDDSDPNSLKKVVAVFYLHAPDNSADLLILKNTRRYCEMGIDPRSIPNEEIFPVSVKTGDLVIHKVDLPHAVGEHKSDDHRLCLVMEFLLK